MLKTYEASLFLSLYLLFTNNLKIHAENQHHDSACCARNASSNKLG